MRFVHVFAIALLAFAFLAFASGIGMQIKGMMRTDDACWQKACGLRDLQSQQFRQAGEAAMWFSLPSLLLSGIVVAIVERKAPAQGMPGTPWRGEG